VCVCASMAHSENEIIKMLTCDLANRILTVQMITLFKTSKEPFF